MTEFTRKAGFELPILEPGVEVATTKDAMRTMAALGNTSIIRTVTIQTRGMNPGSLLQLVDAADEQFEIAASYCNATVVEHSWGLRKIAGFPNYNQHTLIPPGHGLVAEVKVIQDVQQLEPSQSMEVTRGLYTYRQEHGPIVWRDAIPNQFVYGKIDQESKRARYMVGVDPCLSYLDPQNK